MNANSKNKKLSIKLSEIFKAFASYYKPYMIILIMDLVCALVLATVDLAFPQLLRFFTNDFFTRPAEQIFAALFPIAVSLLALYLIRTASQFFITRWGHIIGAKMEADMRRDLFAQYQRLSFSYYDKNRSGDMASRILTDLFDISELAHHGPENILICSLKIIGSFILLFMINIPLTIVMLICTIIMTTYSAWINYKRRNVFTLNRQRMSKMNQQIQDSLGGIRTVKSFGNEEGEIDKFSDINQGFLDTKKETYKLVASFNAANSLFQGVLYTVVIVGGGFCVASGTLAVNELAIFALYIGIFIAPIELLINFIEPFQKGYAGFKRFMEIMAERPDVQEKPNAIDVPDDINTDIEYKNVYFTYKNEDDEDNPITLEDLNLKISEGKKLAIVGPSGEGKTTTCTLLPRFYDVDSGEITIGGYNICDFKLDSLRHMIGIVQQDVYIFDGSIADNIAYGMNDVDINDIVNAAKAASIHDFVLSLQDGYDTKLGERGTRLSGGQKQRIAIARLFLRNPKIVILDEATSALDNVSEAIVQKSLDKLCEGRTTIIIAHRLSTIRSADEIAVIHEGHVTEFGNHEQLMAKRGIYYDYQQLQNN